MVIGLKDRAFRSWSYRSLAIRATGNTGESHYTKSSRRRVGR